MSSSDEFNEMMDLANDDESAYEKAKNEERDWCKGKDLRVLAERFKELKLEKETVEGMLKEINARFDVLRFESIPAKVDEMGLESPVKLEGIGRVSLSGDILCSIKGGFKGALFTWLRENGVGDMIKEEVNASTLKSFVKNRMKDGRPYPEDMLRVTPVTKASVLK